ncbi:MAG TPA: lysylphosphatidylglycerol synthase domain-containing protein [Gaiellaceae bacterium]|nr:lysylphosphatidylglycerol synthase domain-containing protein [Gaiellaceae bacterium]
MKITRSTLLGAGAALAALALLAAIPTLLGNRLHPALAAVAGGDRRWLAVALAAFAAGFVCTVLAWRAAFAAAGGRLCPREAAARLGIGCAVNSFAPAKLGDAVKVALCSQALDRAGRMWTGGGVYAALAAARSLALAAIVVAASATGAIPLWPVFALFGLTAGVAVAALVSRRLRSHPRLTHLLTGVTALARSPRAAATVVAWSFAVQLTRFLGAAAVAQALGVQHPLLAALLIAPALDLAGAFPITPGAFGVGSGAVAVALASRGIGMGQALAVGIAMQALETLVSVFAGAVGGLYLLRLNPVVQRWSMRVAVAGASTGLVLAVGALVLDAL